MLVAVTAAQVLRMVIGPLAFGIIECEGYELTEVAREDEKAVRITWISGRSIRWGPIDGNKSYPNLSRFLSDPSSHGQIWKPEGANCVLHVRGCIHRNKRIIPPER